MSIICDVYKGKKGLQILMFTTFSSIQQSKVISLMYKILTTKWRMNIGRDRYWKPHVSNSSALSVPKISKAVTARRKKKYRVK
jgi:hypothetical protein